jgi:23S rRNA pseudouridine1911/1915/1917 synthase
MRFTVEAAERGWSLKRFLTARLPGLSQMYLGGRVLRGLCRVDGEVAAWGRKLRGGELVEIEVDLEAETARRPEAIPLEVLYENDEVLAIHKAAGMLVHPTKHTKSGTVANGVAHHLRGERFWFVHRLDRETSGVLVIAKTLGAAGRLGKLWEQRQVAKKYVALLEGRVEADEMSIEAPIGRDAERKPQWAVDENGKQARSGLRVLRRGPELTLVEMEPFTGRTNQLRLHARHVGHPIHGDTVYGGRPAARLYLHAARVEFEGRVVEADDFEIRKIVEVGFER